MMRSRIIPIDPVKEHTIEDENDADFELDDLFKEPKNRSMDAVIEHAQQLIFVDRVSLCFLLVPCPVCHPREDFEAQSHAVRIEFVTTSGAANSVG
jgi:hypothetical protein